MEIGSSQIIDGKVVIRIRDHICDSVDDLLSSHLFTLILKRCIADMQQHNARLLDIFPGRQAGNADIRQMVQTFTYLSKLPAEMVPRVVDGAEVFLRDPALLDDFVEYLYNYWRSLQRLVICDSEGDRFDRHPYRTFNATIETLTHLVRSTYRDVRENITGNHPRIYRQVSAGAEIATIALPRDLDYPPEYAATLAGIPLIRQVLIYPPLIFNPPMNKRTGVFERVPSNPLEGLSLDRHNWLCYPARVGPLLINIHFSLRYFELGFSLANLFELAGDDILQRKPDAVLLYGVPEANFPSMGSSGQTIFFDDTANDLLVGAIPDNPRFGYFGYLKKMALTLHNIRMMKLGRMPFHGALVNIGLREGGNATVLIMGDTGAGKSETLEALRMLGASGIESLSIIADDMGSLDLDANGRVRGYGTETGAFVRLDDLKPGYAFGQIDRTIIMSPAEVNARAVLPVTTYEMIMRGFPIDCVLYANNYEPVDDAHPIIERFDAPAQALETFRCGRVMSKGTTTSTGLVETYFANVFGPQQYQKEHEALAERFFDPFFQGGLFVGQLRTRLGIPGNEESGPADAARALLELIQSHARRGMG